MSIRIQNDQTADIASSSAQRAEQSPRSASGETKSGGISGEAEDQVDVSSVATSIGAAVSAQTSARSGRVHQLGLLYASGQYNADSLKTSQAILTGALGTAGANRL